MTLPERSDGSEESGAAGKADGMRTGKLYEKERLTWLQPGKKREISALFPCGKEKLFGVSTLFTVFCSALTHTLPSKSVTDEVGWTRAGLSAERAEASWTAGWKTQKQKDPCIRGNAATLVHRSSLVSSSFISSVENNGPHNTPQ